MTNNPDENLIRRRRARAAADLALAGSLTFDPRDPSPELVDIVWRVHQIDTQHGPSLIPPPSAGQWAHEAVNEREHLAAAYTIGTGREGAAGMDAALAELRRLALDVLTEEVSRGHDD